MYYRQKFFEVFGRNYSRKAIITQLVGLCAAKIIRELFRARRNKILKTMKS
jgi:hypothetical protein